MKFIFLLFCFIATTAAVFAMQPDTVKIPLFRVGFHDKIDNEQVLGDKADGKLDSYLHVSKNEEINLQVTDAFFRKVDDLQTWVETNEAITTNNDKIRYLRLIENMVKSFRISWRNKEIKPIEFPALYYTFENIFKELPAQKTMLPHLQAASYEVAKINSSIFFDSNEYLDAQKIVYLKYTQLHPDNILKTIRPYANEPFADSLVVVACKNNPVQLYSYAQSVSTTEGKLIHRNPNTMVKVVAQLSQTPNALLYFPFLDDLLSGKNTVENIRQYVGDEEKKYDSIGYFKLLVKTEIEYFKRMAPPLRDTPIAMFGANSLREVLRGKALQHFIKPINELHDATNLAVRMKAIQPLGVQELYYMLIMGEADIYTSSYKHSYNRMMQLMGAKPRGDSLLQSVHFDFFKKFIKMAANFNRLDTFLKTMPADNSEILMKAFVANLDKTGNLEDAVDVADSYSSISDKNLLNTILTYVKENEQTSINENNNRGTLIYALLKTIFLSADSSNKIDLTATVGIPSIYEIANKDLQDEKGRIVQQVFFYGDEDGKAFFPPFLNSFSSKYWTITHKKEWVEIKSIKGNVWVFANKPLDYNQNLDDSAQVHLTNYFEANEMHPSIVVHRGHSYWLPGTIARMPADAKIVVLGSCGGYQNLNQILELSPDAHIISTKEIGKGDINKPILNYLNQSLLSGNTLLWRDMWKSLSQFFGKDPNYEVRESWEDYIPPYRNLGAIFIKAYHKQTEITEGI
ncbi:MAG TPA: hypothetical protein VLR49_08285 [Ferruginibacter sp.]|nr:hypothetical protein [Ferruginibacter sp.]